MIIKSQTVERILQSVADSSHLSSFRDVRIRCSEGKSESVFCHQTILSSFSPFLSSLLSTSCPCKADVSIILDNTDIQTVQALTGLLYTGSMRVRGEKRKAEVLSLAAMLGMDLNNFCIEEELTSPFPSNGFQAVTLNYQEKRPESENPPKKKRGRPRKIRPEEEAEEGRKEKKARKSSAVSEKIERDRDSSPDIFYHVTNPTFKVKAAEKKTVKKKGRKRKVIQEVKEVKEESAPAGEIPQISLTFDLGGEKDKTINLHQLTEMEESQDVVRLREKSLEAKPSENFVTFASPEEALESIEAEEEALNYSSDDENALIMDLSLSGGLV